MSSPALRTQSWDNKGATPHAAPTKWGRQRKQCCDPVRRRRGAGRRRGRGGAAPPTFRLICGECRAWAVFVVPAFNPSPDAAARVLVSEQARPSRERHRDPGSATAAAAVAGADVARAGQGGRRLQPPPGQRPRRAQVIASRAPGPPVIPWVQPRIRGPRGAAAPPPRPHRGQPSDSLQQELLPAQHAGRRGRGGVAGAWKAGVAGVPRVLPPAPRCCPWAQTPEARRAGTRGPSRGW